MNRLLAAFRDNDENLCGWYYQCKYSMKYQILHVVEQSPSVWLHRARSLCRCGIVTFGPSRIFGDRSLLMYKLDASSFWRSR